MLALIRDMASRSGSSSTVSSSSSAGVRPFASSVITVPPLGSDALGDGCALGGVPVGDGAVGKDVGRYGSVDGCRQVQVDQRHGVAVGQLFARLVGQLLVGELRGRLVVHRSS